MLLLDSGGGSLIHLSPDLYFPPYTTAAVCPADQDPNAQAERVWDQLRAKADSLTSFQALDIGQEVWDSSYGVPKYVQAGFAKCGLIQKNRLTVQEFLEIVGILCSGASYPNVCWSQGKIILDRPQGYHHNVYMYSFIIK